MKDSRKVLVQALFFIIIGSVLVGWSRSITIPSAYNSFLGIPYAVNPEFASSLYEMLALLVFGFLFLGFGCGVLATIGYIVRLEKKIPQSPPPP